MEISARAILLDIEGTTTPVSFVYETLFPYARAHLYDYLAAHWKDEGVIADIIRLADEHRADLAAGNNPPAWRDDPDNGLDSAVNYLAWLMDQDRKSTALKAVQGRIWEEGYGSGRLHGVVYDDVPVAFERWKNEGAAIAIFSSGSVLAQRLIFAHTNHGDLTPYLSAYFDTTTGPKREAGSYRRIAEAIGVETSEVLFYSDVAAELDAARESGMQTALCVREGEAADDGGHRVVRTL